MSYASIFRSWFIVCFCLNVLNEKQNSLYHLLKGFRIPEIKVSLLTETLIFLYLHFKSLYLVGCLKFLLEALLILLYPRKKGPLLRCLPYLYIVIVIGVFLECKPKKQSVDLTVQDFSQLRVKMTRSYYFICYLDQSKTFSIISYLLLS